MKFILLGLLGLAILGMALVDMGSFFRGGVSSMDVAKVGEKRISIIDFDQTLRRQLSQYYASPQDAYKTGLLHNVLGNEIRATFVEIEAEHAGLSLGKPYLQKRISEMVAPNVQEGQTLQQTLNAILQAQNMSEQKFAKAIEREIVADIITESVKSAFPAPMSQLAQDLYLFQNQTRDLELITLTNDSITGIEPPTDEQIQKTYDEQKDSVYATPELRHIIVAVIDDSIIANQTEITDAELKSYYDENLDNFVVPPETVMTQIISQDKAQAEQITSLVKSGQDFKATAEQISGDTATFFENIPFDEKVLLPQIAEAIKGKNKGDIIGPVESPLGIHVIRIEGFNAQTTQSFEAVRESIRAELLNEKRGDNIYQASQTLEDLLAGGAAFAEIAKEIPLKIYDVPSLALTGLNAEGQNPFVDLNADLDADKAMLVEDSFALGEGETSNLLELPSGKYAALRVEAITPKAARPFDDVKKDIENALLTAKKFAANQERLSQIEKDLSEGKTTFKDVASAQKLDIKRMTNISITSALEAPLNDQIRPMIFQAPIGSTKSFPTDNGFVLMHVNGYGLPQITDETQKQISTLSGGLDQEMQDEGFLMYLDALSKRHIAVINENLLRQSYNRESEAEAQ